MITEIRRQTMVVTVVDDATLTVPVANTLTVNGDDIQVADFATGIILITAGAETGTATLDVKYQVKDSNGNYYDHTSATQVTQAGSSIKAIAQLDGAVGRIVYTIADANTEKYEHVTIELVLKS